MDQKCIDGYRLNKGYCLSIENGTKRYETKPVVFKWQTKLDNFQGYFSFVVTLISLACYMISYLVITLKQKFRILPVPKQLMAILCITLFITDLVFLLSNVTYKINIACKVTAITLHFFLLLTHMFVTMISFEFASTFRKTPVSRKTKSNKRCFIYCCVPMLVATLVTLTTLIIDEINSDLVGYGENGICWILNFKAVAIAYIMPALSVYLFSITAVVYAVRNINNVRNKSNDIKANQYNLKQIVIKLILYLGILEILGFIQIHKYHVSESEEMFNYTFGTLYVIVRSLKGVFICFLVLSNKGRGVFKTNILKIWLLMKKQTHINPRETVVTDSKTPSAE